MKKILLPTDFSDNAWNAIFNAIKIYAGMECTFYLLHAYIPHTVNMLAGKSQQRLGIIYDSLSEYSNQELNKLLEYLNKNHLSPNHTFEGISQSAHLELAIQETISTHDIDLVVMGTQGATSASEVFMGSNTVRVLKKIKSHPVLVVPSEYSFQKLNSLVFLTDFTKSYHKFELFPVTELAGLWQASIKVLYIAGEFLLNQDQTANRKILEDRLLTHEYSFKNVNFVENISTSIALYLKENKAEIMALIRHHHSFWDKIIKEPVVKKIAFHSKIPVLMLREH